VQCFAPEIRPIRVGRVEEVGAELNRAVNRRRAARSVWYGSLADDGEISYKEWRRRGLLASGQELLG
jgi:hypothetical protein